MASVQKFTDSAVTNQLRHNAREIVNNSNKDIDKTRTHLNYSPNLALTTLELISFSWSFRTPARMVVAREFTSS